MKRCVAMILTLLLPLTAAACGDSAESGENNSSVQSEETFQTDSSPETEPESDHINPMEEDAMKTDQIYIQVGENTLTAILEDNESAKALKELLADGPLTISASNYGGFEKVCALGANLPRNARQTTTQAGDICLYNGSQIVIFYGSNSWAYTRLGKISDADGSKLERILSGEESEITLSLGASR